jgi:hypothetical protein
MSDTVTWYEVKGYGILEVNPIQVVKRTPSTITVRESSCYVNDRTFDVRRNLDGRQFETLEEANADIVKRYESKIKYLEAETANYRRHLAKWNENHS